MAKNRLNATRLRLMSLVLVGNFNCNGRDLTIIISGDGSGRDVDPSEPSNTEVGAAPLEAGDFDAAMDQHDANGSDSDGPSSMETSTASELAAMCSAYAMLWARSSLVTETTCYRCTHREGKGECPGLYSLSQCEPGNKCVLRHCLCTSDLPANSSVQCAEATYPRDLCECIMACFSNDDVACIPNWWSRMECHLRTCAANCE